MAIADFKLNSTLDRLITLNLTTARIVPILLGEAAIGKSARITSLAESLDSKAFVINANTLADKADVTATKVVTDESGNSHQIFLPMKTVRDANEYAAANPGKPVLVFIDEINRTDSDVTSALLTMVTDRTNGDMPLADNIRFIIAGNDRGNVVELDSASISRFALYHVVPDADIFMEILGDRLNPYIRNVLSVNPELILEKPAPAEVVAGVDVDVDDDEDAQAFSLDFSDPNSMRQFTAPRTLEGLSDTLNQIDRNEFIEMIGEEMDGSNLLYQMIIAHIGETTFAEKLATHISEDVVKIPAQAAPTAPTPKKPSLWDSIAAMSTNDEIVAAVDDMTPDERGDMFVYSTWTDRDNMNPGATESMLSALFAYQGPGEVAINRDRLTMLVTLSSAGKLDSAVVDRISEDTNANSTLATNLGPTISLLTQN